MRWNSSILFAPGTAPARPGLPRRSTRLLSWVRGGARGSVERFRWRRRGLGHHRLLFLRFGGLGRLFFRRCGFGRSLAWWLGGGFLLLLLLRWWRIGEVLLLLAQCYQIGFKLFLFSLI